MNGRIKILDGFRTLAIIAVLLFHFFSRFVTPRYGMDLYPYGKRYDFFQYGYLGVEFFFIISGFVIFFTLEYTKDFFTFWKKRLIRLWPSMLIASLIIFIFFNALGVTDNRGAKLENFIPGLLLTSPKLLNNILEKFGIMSNLDYLNGSFWSLWVEVQFYFFVSVIYFFNKEKFLRNFIGISIFFVLLNLVLHNMGGSNILRLSFAKEIAELQIKWFDTGLNLFNFLPYFASGVIFYTLFKNRNEGKETSWFIKAAVVLFMLFLVVFGRNIWERLVIVMMYVLFFVFVYAPGWISFLENRWIAKTGEGSYFLYLIHENIGVFIIVALGSYFLPYGFILPLLLILFFIIISIWYTEHVDVKINRWLRRKIK